MARKARRESIDPTRIQTMHVSSRCVRQCYLCGKDAITGRDFSHRRAWILKRWRFLASIFGIDTLTMAIMSNHYHLVLRSRPDIVAEWSDEEIAIRWLTMCPKKRHKDGSPKEPTPNQISEIVNDSERLAELRRRLSDISWWMKFTNEYIARMANREVECRGHFWEGRFENTEILDEASLLACAMYVDLNPIRAAMAQTPEKSEFTGAKSRIDDLRQTPRDSERRERERDLQQSNWLSPIEIKDDDPLGVDLDPAPYRASLKGFLPISLHKYLSLLDVTGRMIRQDKRGAIPAHLAPIFDRLGLNQNKWATLMTSLSRCFKRVIGQPASLQQEAKRRGQTRLNAPGVHLLTR